MARLSGRDGDEDDELVDAAGVGAGAGNDDDDDDDEMGHFDIDDAAQIIELDGNGMEVADEDGDGDGAGVEDEDEDEEEEVADTATRTWVQTGTRRGEPVYALAVKGTTVVSGGGDDAATMWGALDAADGGRKIAQHKDSVVAVAFSFDGSMVAVAGMDAVVSLVDAATGAKLRELEGPAREIEWVSCHPAGPVVLAGSADGTAWMWDATTGAVMNVFSGHADSVSCGDFTPNGRRIVTGSLDGTLKLWDPRTAQCLHTFSGHGWHEEGAGVLAVDFLRGDEPTVATGAQDGTACVVRLDSRKILAKLQHAEARRPGAQQQQQHHGDDDDDEEAEELDSVDSVQFCPANAAWLATAGTDGRVVVWEWATRSRRAVLAPPTPSPLVRVVWLKQPAFHLVTAAADGVVRVWDGRGAKLVSERTGHRDAILDMVVSEDSRFVVTAGEDAVCKVFVL